MGREIFSLFDKNSDGKITSKDIGNVMCSIGQNPNDFDLVKMIAEVDSIGNGTIDFPDFLMMMAKKVKRSDIEEEFLETFKVFDIYGNGFISADVLYQVLKILCERMTEEEIEKMLQEVDNDNDGLINYEEFVKVMTIYVNA